MATVTATAYAAGLAVGVRSCAENNTHEEDEDENPLLPTKKVPPPPAALRTTSSPPPLPPPPPLLALLEQVPDLFTKKVLARLTPTDAALFGRASRACRAVVVESTALKAQQEAAAAKLAVEKSAAALKAQPPGFTGAGFISADSFEGPKVGYIYRIDSAGLGYYVDNQAAADLRSSLDLALANARLPPPSLTFEASNFVATTELSMWAVTNGCTWADMGRAVAVKTAAEVAAFNAAAAQAAAAEAAAAAAAEKATAEATVAELSACVEAAFNDLDVDGTGVNSQKV
jgi:hypothetical protein